MAINTGLFGPFELTEDEIDKHVGAGLGAYALGNEVSNMRTEMTIRYVGRSDDNLNKRLKDWLRSYKFFFYGHFSDISENYKKECWLYHTFGGLEGKLDNRVHPAKPYSSLECPMKCGA